MMMRFANSLRQLRFSLLSKAATTSASDPTAQPLRRRIVHALLYGKVDRAAKARARVGLAIALFAGIYGVIAGRLVLHALMPESHVARRVGSSDAVATARPDITDRRGDVLATDVPASSLFGDPRQLDALDRLPERPPELVPPGTTDPIGAVIESLEEPDAPTGSVPNRGATR